MLYHEPKFAKADKVHIMDLMGVVITVTVIANTNTLTHKFCSQRYIRLYTFIYVYIQVIICL
jgi:hypothetical protein